MTVGAAHRGVRRRPVQLVHPPQPAALLEERGGRRQGRRLPHAVGGADHAAAPCSRRSCPSWPRRCTRTSCAGSTRTRPCPSTTVEWPAVDAVRDDPELRDGDGPGAADRRPGRGAQPQGPHAACASRWRRSWCASGNRGAGPAASGSPIRWRMSSTSSGSRWWRTPRAWWSTGSSPTSSCSGPSSAPASTPSPRRCSQPTPLDLARARAGESVTVLVEGRRGGDPVRGLRRGGHGRAGVRRGRGGRLPGGPGHRGDAGAASRRVWRASSSTA